MPRGPANSLLDAVPPPHRLPLFELDNGVLFLAQSEKANYWNFMRTTTALILVGIAGLVPDSAHANGKVLYPVVVNDRWGFVDKSGSLVTQPQFERAGAFSE